jgi:hypothetical protein
MLGKPTWAAFLTALILALGAACAATEDGKDGGSDVPGQDSIHGQDGALDTTPPGDLAPSDTTVNGDTVDPTILDGTWDYQTVRCNQADPVYIASQVLVIDGPEAYIQNNYCKLDCTFTIKPEQQIDWVIDSHNCPCVAPSCPCDPPVESCGAGLDRHFSYVLDGATLTLTEDPAPANDYTCPNGKAVSVLTKR